MAPERPVEVAPLPLPDEGTGARRSRRYPFTEVEEEPGDAVRRLLPAILAMVAVTAVLVSLGWSRTAVPAARRSALSGVPAAAAPHHDRSLLVGTDQAGQLSFVTILTVDRSGSGGDIVFVPTGTMVEVPSLGLESLAEAWQQSQLLGVQQAMANLLGLDFDRVGVVDPHGLALMATKAGLLDVHLPTAVEAVAPSGDVDVLFPAGAVRVTPGQAPALLEAPGRGTDLDRLVRHQAWWEAWLKAIGRDPSLLPGDDLGGGIGHTIGAVAKGGVDFHVLPVVVLSSTGGDSEPLYRVDVPAVTKLLREVAPEAADASASRVTVQVLNGTGLPGIGRNVEPLLLPTGVELVLSGNADNFDYRTTQIVYYDDRAAAAASKVQQGLGVGRVVKSRNRLDVVDLTIVVGADLVPRLRSLTP